MASSDGSGPSSTADKLLSDMLWMLGRYDDHIEADQLDALISHREQLQEKASSRGSVKICEHADLVTDLQVHSYGQGSCVEQVLELLHRSHKDQDILKDINTWLNRKLKALALESSENRGVGELRLRFGDGIDSVKPIEAIKKVEFYKPDYRPGLDDDLIQLAEDIADWYTPKGAAWPKEAVDNLINNCKFMQGHINNNETDIVVPVYIYTSAMYHRILWAMWIPGQERYQELQHSPLLEKAWKEAKGPHFQIDSLAVGEIVKLLNEKSAASISLLQQQLKCHEAWDELTVFVVFIDGAVKPRPTLGKQLPVYVIRYENSHGELNCLSDSVAWLPPPTDAFFEKSIFSVTDMMPPPGVLEFLESRPWDEKNNGSSDQMDLEWNANPVTSDESRQLIKDCYEEPNQSRYNPDLHQGLRDYRAGLTKLDRMTDAVRKAVDYKLGGVERPTPQAIAHTLELQCLTWRHRQFIIGLSGDPRVIVDVQDIHLHTTKLYRVYHEYKEQPYQLLNATMRNLQDGNDQAYLEVFARMGEGIPGRYLLKGDVERNPVPLHHETTGRTVQWVHNNFWKERSGILIPEEQTKLRLGVCMLDKLRPLLYYLKMALDKIPPHDTVVKSYRGLADVKFPRDMYNSSSLVLWAAYSSSSADQATATWFAMQEGSAAVFTLKGRSCKLIGPWSRFAREMEWLYPPNTCFQVKTMLTEDQQQILGKEELQLYECDEVDDHEALTIHITSIINSAITQNDRQQLVQQLSGLLHLLLPGRKQMTDALEKAVDPSEPLLSSPSGMQIINWLKPFVVSEHDDGNSEEDITQHRIDTCPHILETMDKAIIKAAKEGHADAIPRLIELGATCTASEDDTPAVLLAIMGGHEAAARCLLEAEGRDVLEYVQTVVDKDTGMTLLHQMAVQGEEKAVKVLLSLGANPEVVDKKKQTPALMAHSAGHRRIVTLLNPENCLPESVLAEYSLKGSGRWVSEYGEVRNRFSDEVGPTTCMWDIASSTFKQHEENENIWALAESLHNWNTPIGKAWPSQAVDDMIKDCRTITERHRTTQSINIVVPILLYTVSIYDHTVWALWVPPSEGSTATNSGWKALMRSTVQLEEEFMSPSEMLPLTEAIKDEISMVLSRNGKGAIESCSLPRSNLLPKLDSCNNVYFFGDSGSNLFLMRYSPPVYARPLCSAIAWLPEPKEAMTLALPPHGLVEYIYARPCKDNLSQQHVEKANWTCEQATPKAFLDLLTDDVRRNPIKYNPTLHDKLLKLLEQHRESSPAVYSLIQQKLHGISRPTPEMIEHALDVQELCEDGGRRFFLSLTAEPRLLLICGTWTVHHIFRVCKPAGPSPSEHLTTAMRNYEKPEEPHLEVSNLTRHKGLNLAGKYELAGKPSRKIKRRRRGNSSKESRESRERPLSVSQNDVFANSADDNSLSKTLSFRDGEMLSPNQSFTSVSSGMRHSYLPSHESVEAVEFIRTSQPRHIARWDEEYREWAVVLSQFTHGPGATKKPIRLRDAAILHMGTCMWHFVRPLWMALHTAVMKLEPPRQTQLLFRCIPQRPDHDEAKKTIWGTFTSSTKSCSVALSQHSKDDVSILCIESKTARDISKWSRLAREREWVHLPDSVFRNETKQKGSSEITLREVTDTEALAECIMLVCDKKLLEDSEIAQELLEIQKATRNRDLMKAMRLACNPTSKVIRRDIGREVARRCLQLAAMDSVVLEQLSKAAEYGHADIIMTLHSFLSNPTAFQNSDILHKAITNGHFEAASKCMELKATIDLGREIIKKAAEERDSELSLYVLLRLAKREANESSYKVPPAALANHRANKYCTYIIKWMTGSLDPLPREQADLYNEDVNKVLRQAVEEMRLNAILAILNFVKNSTTSRDHLRDTSLHHAARKPLFNRDRGLLVFEELVKKAQDGSVNLRNQDSRTPLVVAAENGHVECVKVLLKHGADCFPPPSNGKNEVSDVISSHIKERVDKARDRLRMLNPEITNSLQNLTKIVSEDGKVNRRNCAAVAPHAPYIIQYIRGGADPDHITAEEFQVLFICSGPPNETDESLTGRVHGQLAVQGKLDTAKALPLVADDEERGRLAIANEEDEEWDKLWAGFRAKAKMEKRTNLVIKEGKGYQGKVFGTPDQEHIAKALLLFRKWLPVWWIVKMTCVIYNGYALTWQLLTDTPTVSTHLDILVDLIHILNVFVQLQTPALLSESMLCNPYQRSTYLKLDVIAAIPAQFIALLVGMQTGPVWRANRLLSLLTVGFTWRLLREWITVLNAFQMRFIGLLLVFFQFHHTWALVLLKGLRDAKMHETHSPVFNCSQPVTSQYTESLYVTLLGYRGAIRLDDPSDVQIVVLLITVMFGWVMLATCIPHVTKLIRVCDLKKQELEDLYEWEADMIHSTIDPFYHEDFRKVYNLDPSFQSFHEELWRHYKLQWYARREVKTENHDYFFTCLKRDSPWLHDTLVEVVNYTVRSDISLFGTLHADQLSMLVASTRFYVVAKGTKIIKEGEEPACLYFIQDGEVSVYLNGKFITNLKKNELFGEGVFTQDTTAATVVANTKCRLYAVSGQGLQEMKKIPTVWSYITVLESGRRRNGPNNNQNAMAIGDWKDDVFYTQNAVAPERSIPLSTALIRQNPLIPDLTIPQSVTISHGQESSILERESLSSEISSSPSTSVQFLEQSTFSRANPNAESMSVHTDP
eukprot:Sspe_Gene.6488::Locus_2186_Transcript_1_1_Confidence_1.000_Length_8729::g.6488::m.6488